MKKLLLFIAFLPLLSLGQSLNGTYSVGTGQSAPFNTLQNAIAHVNSVGVSGPVVFKILNNQNATAPYVISSFSGSSQTNTLTIQPAENQNITISVSNPNSYTGLAAVIKVFGGDNIIINGSNNNTSSRNLTLQNTNYVNYVSQTIVWIASDGTNSANNVTVQNTILRHTNRNQEGRWLSGVFSGGNGSDSNLSASVASSNNSSTQILNNEFVNIRQGVHVNSSNNTASRITNFLAKDNQLVSSIDNQKPDLGFYFINAGSFTIDKNTINGLRSNTNGSANMYGIRVTNGVNYTISNNQILNYEHPSNHMLGSAVFVDGTSTSNAVVTKNIIRDIKNSGGGIVRGIDVNTGNSSTSNILITNNFVSGVVSNGTTTNSGNGIFVRAGRDIKIIHNTVVMNSNQNNIHAALYVNSGSFLNVINNIFVNSSTSGTRYAVYSFANSGAYSNINYNNYYSTQHIGYLGSNRTTLANWITATQKDAQSLNLLPEFVSSTDLHLTNNNPDLDNKGTFSNLVTVDIDNEVRSTTTPDMGADEFSAEKCSVTTTWNGNFWSHGVPDEFTKVILNGNYNTEINGNLIACELVINENVDAIIAADNYFQIESNVKINGNLTVLDSGSFVQVEDESTIAGEILVYRNTTPMKALDYSYWSSPVQDWKLNQLSPNTNAARFHSFNPTIGNWVTHSGGNHIMQTGKGYIVRAPSGWSLTNATNGVFEGHFIGVPNNGPIGVEATKGASTFNLIGNPYPSAIDIDKFILDPANKEIFDGTIYLWTHNTAISASIPGNQVYNYTADDYASYNLTGGVKTSKMAITGAVTPTGKVASGQSFFINVKDQLSNGTYLGEFNNSMRIVEENNQFFRYASESTSNQGLEKNRLWLAISNENGAYHETLLGYVEEATNEIDYGFDGKYINGGNFVSIYSILDENKLSIQGRSLSFDENEIIPIGYVSTISGSMAISIEQFDGFFTYQNIYLYDTSTNLYHDLKLSPFTFEVTPGTFDSRFELRFTNETLSINNPIVNETRIQLIKSDKRIEVKSQAQLESISIYDITGKQLAVYNEVQAETFSSDELNVTNQVLIVKMVLENKEVVTRKLIF